MLSDFVKTSPCSALILIVFFTFQCYNRLV